MLALGSCFVQIARLFPSAGGYFTYVSRTLGPRAGFLTGWAYTLYSPILAGPILAFFGSILQGELQTNYGIDFPWWAFALITIPLIGVLGLFGVRLSVKAMVILGALEFVIVLALGLSGLISPGAGGFTFRVFDPGYDPGHMFTASGFMLAIVFSVQGLTGWESAAPLAEETSNPRRNVPIATMVSIVVGVCIVVVLWGQIIGWGVNVLPKLPSSVELPALVVAHRVWGAAWFFGLAAMFTSAHTRRKRQGNRDRRSRRKNPVWRRARGPWPGGWSSPRYREGNESSGRTRFDGDRWSRRPSVSRHRMVDRQHVGSHRRVWHRGAEPGVCRRGVRLGRIHDCRLQLPVRVRGPGLQPDPPEHLGRPLQCEVPGARRSLERVRRVSQHNCGHCQCASSFRIS